MRRVVKGEVIPHAVFKGHHSVMYRLIASCANFGTSAADVAVGGGITTTATIYYHPQLGNNSNSGLTPLLPKQTPPFFTPEGNTKHLIASGSTIAVPQNFINYFNLSNDNTVFSVYDANTSSTSFGQEITNFESPFSRALLGSWVNETERLTKYYTIDGLDINNVNNDRAINIGGASTNVNVCIRGAWIRNARRNGIVCRKTNVRIEDCVFENVQNGLVNAEGYGGVAIRAQDPACNTNIARCWISGTGEDAMWLYDANTHVIADCAIIHEPTRQVYGEQHCDVFQWSTAVTNFTMRRVIAYHFIRESALLPNPSQTASVGAFITDTQGPVLSGGLMEDVIYITNRQGTNFEQRGGVIKNRCIEYQLDNQGPAGNAGLATWQQASNQVNNGVMCQPSTLANAFNATLGAGAFVESNMRYYNLSSEA